MVGKLIDAADVILPLLFLVLHDSKTSLKLQLLHCNSNAVFLRIFFVYSVFVLEESSFGSVGTVRCLAE